MQVGVQHHRENLKKKTSPKQPKKRKNTTICKRCVWVEIFFIVHYKTCFKSQVVKSWGALMLTSTGQWQKRPRWLLLPSHQSGKVSIVNTVTRSRSRSQEERSLSVRWIVWILQRFLTLENDQRKQSRSRWHLQQKLAVSSEQQPEMFYSPNVLLLKAGESKCFNIAVWLLEAYLFLWIWWRWKQGYPGFFPFITIRFPIPDWESWDTLIKLFTVQTVLISNTDQWSFLLFLYPASSSSSGAFLCLLVWLELTFTVFSLSQSGSLSSSLSTSISWGLSGRQLSLWKYRRLCPLMYVLCASRSPSSDSRNSDRLGFVLLGLRGEEEDDQEFLSPSAACK